jgi:hypothetical protein
MSKTCTKCFVVKEETDFYIRHDRKNLRYAECKSCIAIRTTKDVHDRKQEAILYLGGKCMDCKGVFHSAIYQFHHLDPRTKDIDWKKIKRRSFEQMKPELDKCVLLCANCHVLRHTGGNW